MRLRPIIAAILLLLVACDSKPPLVNEFIAHAPGPITESWIHETFLRENPNASNHRFIDVNSEQLLTDIDQIRLSLLTGEIVTATKVTSTAFDGSIRWNGVVQGNDDSHVQILATNNPYMTGHIVIGDRVELFEHAVPIEDGIMYEVDMPAMSIASKADILPDVDPSRIEGVAWKGLVSSLPASAYRITTFNNLIWREKISELEQTGATSMRFLDDTEYRVVAGNGYPKIDGEELSSVTLKSYGGRLRGGVFSRSPGAVRVTRIYDTDYYVVWMMHPELEKKID